jgi:ankyrin repeat protein
MPLHAASYNGRLVVAKQLINAGVDVNHLDESEAIHSRVQLPAVTQRF